ncbi:hypothetical protein [Dyadobacter sp. CY312]|uniref:hypothetical protein n=1 Tax=Dyadobacter sp. CY312 TaxID=2907303 RepID=UPI001F3507A7|nr:hypothetical protein [Dyadobacter sp. CY312]MCE7044344.1 hypothetical protein [Dyadobacter sp. CY312]
MPILLQVIEYPDVLSQITIAVIAKIPYADTLWKILSFLWILSLGYLVLCINKKPLNNKYLYIYLTVSIVGILGFRFPNLVLPMLNYDEADWAVCAATLWNKSVFWKDVDATTSGPLNIYPLLLIKIVGGNINYFTLRLFLLLFCCIPTFVFSFLAVRQYTSPSLAAAMTAPLAIGFAMLNETDLVSFDSTYIPMVTLAFASYLLLSVERAKNKISVVMTLGFILGLLPFIKLQAVPIGIGLGLWLLCAAHFLWKLPTRAIFYILISCFAPSILVGIYIFSLNTQSDFWESYVLNNLLYAELGVVGQEKNWWFKARVPLYLISTSPTISPFFYCLSGIGILSSIYCFINFIKMEFRDKINLIGSIFIFLLSYYSISQPGNICHYYLILLIVPLFFWASISFISAKKIMDSKNYKYRTDIYISLLLITVGLQGLVSIKKGSFGVNIIEKGYSGTINSPLIGEIKGLVKPDDFIAVLGYRPDIYISSNTLLGIREAQTTRMHFAFKNLQKEYYENRIASDIIANEPKLIIDASLNSNISYPYNDSTTVYENYPAIRKVIDSNYSYHATIDQIRIFVKK